MKNMMLLLLAFTLTPVWASDSAALAESQPAMLMQTALDPEPDATTSEATPDGTTAACPVGCRTMACPPPNGTVQLCCPVAPYTQTCP